MKKANLYWSVYRNLEKELSSLANIIHIDDKQLEVYSMKIADLLVRTCVEIESISKALYCRENNKALDSDECKDMYFDTNCLKELDEKWKLSEKIVFVTAPYLYFDKDENKQLTPLKKASERGHPAWKSAYQAVKHNRENDFKKGTFKNFIYALAALYILNIYYINREIAVKRKDDEGSVNAYLGSSVFSIKVHHQISKEWEDDYKKDENFDQCLYFIETIKKYKEKQKKLRETIEKEFKKYNSCNSSMDSETKNKMFWNNNVREILEVVHATETYKAVLNKNQPFSVHFPQKIDNEQKKYK